ncbi:hypothetical protein AOE01nite_31630 [Acetobacter oeni]|uniref:Leucine-binding protein domain-containing protein n=1 Tax=Acetobacter oeni TaxID=304077 RepID=A0A511XPV1_9PROT|nr:hypothetical protein AOE01nite_31630 [Acetobacter oeni]
MQRNVAVLLPLTGPNAVLGNEMLSAARLALSRPAGSTTLKATTSLPQVDAHDTAGPGGAAGAAQAAIAAGDGIILGPLTSPDTSLIAPAALQASVPVIAFTSDANQKRPGVWVFGITPQQQVDRLVAAGVAEGRHQFAAFLPDNPLGHALGDALIQSCHAKGLADPLIAYHVNTPEAISAGLATLSAYDSRVAAASGQATGSASDLPPDLAAALSSAPKADSVAPSDGNTASANKQITGGEAGNAATAASQALSAPPFDALLLGDLGLSLKNVIDGLKTNQISGSQVRLMGPGLWSAFSLKLGSIGGAWYAAPDPSDRKVFVQNFTTQMHRAPKPLADLAYDAGALAGSVSASSGGKGYPVDIMTRSQGFTGVDGLFTLLPDGSTTRDLAIFEIQAGGGARIIATQSTRGPSAPDAI